MPIAPAEFVRKHLATDEGVNWLFGMDVRTSADVELGEIYKMPIRGSHGMFLTGAFGINRVALVMHPLTYASLVGVCDWERAIELRAEYHQRELKTQHYLAETYIAARFRLVERLIRNARLAVGRYEAIHDSPVTWGDPGE